MQRHVLETIIGAVVLLLALGFLIFAYKGSEMNVAQGEGYTLKARFANVSGINTGSDVRIGGIKVGIVSDMQLDPETYDAVVFMHVGSDTKVPDDSSAAIVSSGLLGDKFIQLTPGGSDTMFKDGAMVAFTQSSVSLEELIGKFMFSGGGVESHDTKKSGNTAADAQHH